MAEVFRKFGNTPGTDRLTSDEINSRALHEELSMYLSKWIRRFHRWVSIAFVAGVVVNFIAIRGGEEPPSWIYIFALLPLAALLLSGVYLFVLPYFLKARAAGDSDSRI